MHCKISPICGAWGLFKGGLQHMFVSNADRLLSLCGSVRGKWWPSLGQWADQMGGRTFQRRQNCFLAGCTCVKIAFFLVARIVPLCLGEYFLEGLASETRYRMFLWCEVVRWNDMDVAGNYIMWNIREIVVSMENGGHGTWFFNRDKGVV